MLVVVFAVLRHKRAHAAVRDAGRLITYIPCSPLFITRTAGRLLILILFNSNIKSFTNLSHERDLGRLFANLGSLAIRLQLVVNSIS